MESKKTIMEDNWLKTKDIEKKFGLSHATVNKLIHTKGCPVLRIGRSIRIKESDFNDFLAAYMGKTLNIQGDS